MIALAALLALGSSLPAPCVGDPFPLRVGESVELTRGPTVTWTHASPAGTCGSGHSECVMVTPPRAEIEIAYRGATTRLTLLLVGDRSRGVAGEWVVDLGELAPNPFDASYVASGRLRAVLVVKRNLADVR